MRGIAHGAAYWLGFSVLIIFNSCSVAASSTEQMNKATQWQYANAESDSFDRFDPLPSKPAPKIQPNQHNSLSFLKNTFIMLSLDLGFATAGETQTLTVDPVGQNTYNNLTKNQELVQGELFLGLEKALSETVLSQWGVVFSGGTSAKINGEIWQFADSDFNNLDYNYSVDQLRLGVRTKLIADSDEIPYGLKPYITGSLGINFNHAYGFQNEANIPQAVANPNFTDMNMTAFSYSAGLGMQKELTPHMQVGLGYELFDWGKSSLAPAPGQRTDDALVMNHLYTNNLLLSLTYRTL